MNRRRALIRCVRARARRGEERRHLDGREAPPAGYRTALSPPLGLAPRRTVWLCPARVNVSSGVQLCWARRICVGSCESMLAITIPREPIDHWTRMRRSHAQFSRSDASCRTPWLAGCITNTSGFRFSAHTGEKYQSMLHMLRAGNYCGPRRCLRAAPRSISGVCARPTMIALAAF